QSRVAAEIHLAHAALAQSVEQLILPQVEPGRLAQWRKQLNQRRTSPEPRRGGEVHPSLDGPRRTHRIGQRRAQLGDREASPATRAVGALGVLVHRRRPVLAARAVPAWLQVRQRLGMFGEALEVRTPRRPFATIPAALILPADQLLLL